MDLKACYEAMGGDYADAMGRLRNERIIRKFLFKFLDDGSYALLQSSIAAGDAAEAFRAAHTLKGVCQNLSFNRLYASASQLTEALRSGWSDGAPALARQVEEDYRRTVGAIETYRAESEVP